jgi:DNA-directed RNA polymerase specialized sigma24 family protein
MSEQGGGPPDSWPPEDDFVLQGSFGAGPGATARHDRLVSLIHRRGRRLFTLAFWLGGSLDEAEERSQDALLRLLDAGDAAPSGDAAPRPADAPVPVAEEEERRGRRLVLAAWRRGRGFGRARWGDRGRRRVAEPALHAALARLDPDQRAVLVLRMGEGLDEAEVASLLSIDTVMVRDCLARARGRIARHLGAAASGGRRRLDHDEEVALSGYLDGRLDPERHAAFERRLQTDRVLRAAVELHRGLTLEFHEEAPPLPRGYQERARKRLGDAPRDGTPPDDRRPGPAALWMAGGAVVVLAVILGLLIHARPPLKSEAVPAEGAVDDTTPATAAPTPDAETVRALQSLGYLAATRPTPRPTPPRPSSPAALPRDRAAAVPRSAPAATAVPDVRGSATPEEAAPPPPAASPSPVVPEASAGAASAAAPESVSVPEPAPAGTPAAGEAGAEPSPAPEASSLPFRVVPLPSRPALGLDHEVIRSAPEWSARFPQGDAPAVDFATEMVILLRDALGSAPPSRLRVVAIVPLPGRLRVECRIDRAVAAGSASPPAGQALILPADDRPIQISMP